MMTRQEERCCGWRVSIKEYEKLEAEYKSEEGGE